MDEASTNGAKIPNDMGLFGFGCPRAASFFLVCKADFEQIGPVDGKVNAQQARQKMVEAGLCGSKIGWCMKVFFCAWLEKFSGPIPCPASTSKVTREREKKDRAIGTGYNLREEKRTRVKCQTKREGEAEVKKEGRKEERKKASKQARKEGRKAREKERERGRKRERGGEKEKEREREISLPSFSPYNL